jgi:ribosomal protein S18 acetylase RimI-like enzyme
MTESISLRNAGNEDRAFHFTLYRDVRESEMAAWGWPAAQREAFLKMQFEGQRRGYEAVYPNASNMIVMLDGLPIGRRLVADMTEGIQLVDIALLAQYRNRGIGSGLLRQLLAECEAGGRSLNLQVLRGNPAMRLYQRLGFIEISSDQMYIQMQWTPGEKDA